MNKKENDLIYASTVRKEHEFNDCWLARLGEPDMIVRNPHHRSTNSFLYSRIRVEHFIEQNAEEYADYLHRRRQRKNRKPKVYQFERIYRTKREAYLDASQAVFELNRYAKHSSCSKKHRNLIYDLKNQWIEMLYAKGFCIEAVLARSPEIEKECWNCGGGGCERCDWTGIYRTIGGHEYWAFRFGVDGITFSWHQPLPLWFKVQAIGAGQAHEVLAEEKPVELPSRKFAEAKALIAWCLDQSS